MNASKLGLVQALLHPIESIKTFDKTISTFEQLPSSTWFWLLGIAFGGSLIYGSSLSLMFPGWNITTGAIWITASAGLAWCFFGPGLIYTTRKHPFTLGHACLVTMAYGELILLVGAVSNLLMASSIAQPTALWNFGIVGLSNIVMVTMLALQLGAVGVPWWKSVLSWLLVLNGSGALFFYIFKSLLYKG